MLIYEGWWGKGGTERDRGMKRDTERETETEVKGLDININT